MNIEILFRGKRLVDGKWIYGYYFEQEMHDGMRSYIRTSQSDRFGSDFAVDPATVGQYTRLTDKNGTKIFDGDIVSYVIVTGGIEELEIPANVRHEVTFDEKHAAYKIGYHYACTGTMHEVVEAKNIIVIGNCWDNPELLKGGEK